MIIKLDENKNFIHIVEANKLELDQLRYTFTKKVANWFILKKRNPNWDGEICFIDTLNRISIGLWKELILLCREFNFKLDVIGGAKQFLNTDFDEEDFRNWIKEYFFHEDSNIQPRDYQIEGAIKALKYKRCLEEISTSGGKTFMIFMIFQYLFDKGKIKHALMIVPNLGLISQAEEDFYNYVSRSGHNPSWKSECVYGGTKKKDSVEGNIVFGTYQSLVKRDENYFKNVDCSIIDECLHPDTLIKMGDGTNKKISQVKEGDLVYTINDKTNKIDILPVDYVYHNLSKGQDMFE
ncbi:MAG: DEAD/DEAH box helicase family protein, partial [Clostridia bacterium]